jgi:glutamine synthetase
MINIIVADAFDKISSELEKLTGDKNLGLQKILRRIIREHRRVIFNGDGYGKAWLEEAQKRGLPNAIDTTEALKALATKENAELCTKYNVFTARELQSRFGVATEEYATKVRIEGGIALELASSMILPAATAEYDQLVKALARAKASSIRNGMAALRERANDVGECLDTMSKQILELQKALNGNPSEIIETMENLRLTVDTLEGIVADDRWPLPKYREMLFLY